MVEKNHFAENLITIEESIEATRKRNSVVTKGITEAVKQPMLVRNVVLPPNGGRPPYWGLYV